MGPMISFKKNKLVVSEEESIWRNEHLAVQRPYLVKDDELRPHLKGFSLPETAFRDQLVLYLKKPIDGLLWDKVEQDLKKRNYKLSDIKSVKGQYVRWQQKLQITITEAKTKSGKDIHIDARLALPCGSCL